ncbi:MAG: bacillithiol biosynthesis cysteine-adding enzyme BshC [Bacteroidetes bacterium]|nr:MAG: bacillithiol biosynthesis cysteine-adding enzyme BshC [Bacteroidota bacterium]
MPTDCIPFRETNYFSSLICDYLDENPDLKSFYNRFPNLENFKAQIDAKRHSELVSESHRTILTKVLKKQYQNIRASALTKQNIEDLKQQNTFTITTGHQLNLFTGHLYFLYKIVSTINLTKELKAKYPEYNFVPIYWMATEDHDFEEINYFNFKGKKIHWNIESKGAVGELNTNGLEDVFKIFASEIGQGTNADFLKDLFKNAYLQNNNLAEATRYLANEIFSAYGLVILDGNDSDLKRLFIPFIEEELVSQTSYKKVIETSKRLNNLTSNYKVQVNPREINLFYLNKGLRERIVETDGLYKVNDTEISWSKEDLLKEVHEHPERFSPNVIMRPLYQEVILPNLCYIGGGGELAYWLQLKSYFEAVKVPFPMLLLRNSVLIKTQKQTQKLDKLNLKLQDLFLKQEDLINRQINILSTIDVDFTSQKEHLNQQFKVLHKLAEQTDKSFVGAVAAQEKKQINGLANLEKRLLKAQKRKLNEQITRIINLQNELFPAQSLQERNLNFSELYLEFGERLIQQLVLNLQPLKGEFLILNS